MRRPPPRASSATPSARFESCRATSRRCPRSANATASTSSGADVDQLAEATGQRALLMRMGEYWSLSYEGRTHALRARRGLEHLAALLAEPDREQHVLALAADPQLQLAD